MHSFRFKAVALRSKPVTVLQAQESTSHAAEMALMKWVRSL